MPDESELICRTTIIQRLKIQGAGRMEVYAGCLLISGNVRC